EFFRARWDGRVGAAPGHVEASGGAATEWARFYVGTSWMARSLARASRKAPAHGHPCARRRVSLRPELTIRPGTPRWRRRSVLVAIRASVRPSRETHRARLWAMTFRASHAALAPNLPE